MNKAIITTLIVFLMVGVCNVPSLYAELVWDGGYHEFSEGYESEVDMINGATADITGGEIGILRSFDTTEVFVYEPSEINLLKPFDSSVANVFGGTTGYLFAVGSSETHIYGGSLDWLDAMDSSTVNLYVESYVLDPTGGDFGDGLLTGIWLDGGSFSIDLVTDEAISHINFVPEPSCITFMVIGGLIFSRITKKK